MFVVPKSVYDPIPRRSKYGGISGDHVSWHSCRETIQNCRCSRLLYATNPKHYQQVKDFLGELEEKVGSHLFVEDTNEPNIMLITFAGTWWRQPMRFSFLTAFLRGAQYKQWTSFDEMMSEGVGYLRSTLPAVKRFLDGYTNYTGNAIGWAIAFRNKTPVSVEKLLVE